MTSSSNTFTAAQKIVGSRAELARLLLDEPETEHRLAGHFPRSKTVQLLTGKLGVVLLAIAAGGLMLLRPNMAKRAMRIVPMSAMLRMLASRFLRNT
jgi:hypothetical protein